MAATGYVGGAPAPVRSAGADLAACGERVAGVVEPYAAATRAAIDAAGAAAPAVAVARCGAVWTQALTLLAEQVHALGVVADTVADDLDAAGGS